jgi:hypothetical protein
MKRFLIQVGTAVKALPHKLVTYFVQLSLTYLRTHGEDVRMVYDNPQGSFSFQGNLKYLKKVPIPARKGQ